MWWVDLERRIHAQFYPRHFQSFIMGGCAGLSAIHYHKPAANNCLKVNNNTMLSHQGEGVNKPCFIYEMLIWSLLLLVYIHGLGTEMRGGGGQDLAECPRKWTGVVRGHANINMLIKQRYEDPPLSEFGFCEWIPSLSILLWLPISKRCPGGSPLCGTQHPNTYANSLSGS